jgi:DNA-binding response OmpR family regulator
VIVLDVNLPNVQSSEACREIRRVNTATKVIMFTAMADPATRQAFLGGEHLPSCQRAG